MTIRALTFAALALLVTTAAARTTEPVVSFESMSINTSLSEGQVREVLLSVASTMPQRPWGMTDMGPGKMIARLQVRKHQAVVHITYSARQYSIVYAGSTRMNYNASDNTIIPLYNNVVRELQASIDAALNGSGAAARATAAPAASAPASPVEISFWESVRDSKNPAELQAYLDQYPNGTFAPLARARLAKLK